MTCDFVSFGAKDEICGCYICMMSDYKTITAFDSVLQKINPSLAFIEPLATDKNKQRLRYTFYVADNSKEWLHIMYNHDTVLRYRLKLKKENPAFATGRSLLLP